MYGLVNRTIQEFVISNYNEATWEKIKKDSNVDFEVFVTNQVYDDSVTFALAASSANVLGVSLNIFLNQLGEFWILNTGLKHYSHYMTAGGASFKEFIINLPHFHTRVQLIFDEIRPPEFEITDLKDSSLTVHYFSTRTGLTQFVYGLLNGIGKMFEQEIEITIGESYSHNRKHDVFYVNW